MSNEFSVSDSPIRPTGTALALCKGRPCMCVVAPFAEGRKDPDDGAAVAPRGVITRKWPRGGESARRRSPIGVPVACAGRIAGIGARIARCCSSDSRSAAWSDMRSRTFTLPPIVDAKLSPDACCISRSTYGFAVTAARSLYMRKSVSGVALPGLDIWSISPPSLRMAATNSAQTRTRVRAMRHGRATPAKTEGEGVKGDGVGGRGGVVAPAQKKLLESVCRGQSRLRAMPMLENGFPTQRVLA